MMNNILITGGAGFIGSSLCDKLLDDGYRVIIIDNFNNYYDPKIKVNNINEVKARMKKNNIDYEKLKLVKGDIRDMDLLDDIAQNDKIDLVIHLAAMAGVRPSIQNPKLYYDVNIMGTLNILEMCKKHDIKNVIFASSSSVYGNNKKVPFSVEDSVDNPISPYAATKKSGELLCHTYHHLYNINCICLRFFTVYGPRQRPDLAIHKFTKLISKGEEIPFYGDGSTSRDYTYISDIVDGIEKSINYINNNDNVYELFNLGGDKTISLSEMVKAIELSLGKKAIINRMPMQAGDVNRTCADISKSTVKLGYKPKFSFQEGIDNFVRWFNK